MFDWKTSYSINYPAIDEQHKKLFSIGKKVYHVMYEEKDPSAQQVKILPALKELKDYTVYHFKFEEDLLTKKGYVDLPAHIAEHKKFVTELEKLNNNLSSQYNMKANFELLAFLSNWITKHIMLNDRAYEKCLK